MTTDRKSARGGGQFCSAEGRGGLPKRRVAPPGRGVLCTVFGHLTEGSDLELKAGNWRWRAGVGGSEA